MATSTTFPTSADPQQRETAAQSEQDVRQLADRVVGGAHALVDRTAERLGPAVDKLRSRATETSHALHARADEFGAMQERLVEDSRASVREHPLTWVAAAFAAGVVIGWLGSD